MFGAESGALLLSPGIWGAYAVIGLVGYTCWFLLLLCFMVDEKSGARRDRTCASDDKIWHIIEKKECIAKTI